MKIRDVMTTDIRSAELATTLEALAKMMRDEDIGSVPILDQGELCGIVTDRDIVVRCIAAGRSTSEVTAADILSSDLNVVAPHQDTKEAARLMADLQVRRLPVVENRRLVGVISIGDLAVKSDTEEEMIGRTLEEVSEGVKASGEDAQRAKRSGINLEPLQPQKRRATQPARNYGQDTQNQGQLRQNSNARKPSDRGGQQTPKRQQPGSATQMTERSAKQVKGPKSAAVTGGGRQQTIESESGRFGRSLRGRTETKKSTARTGKNSSGRAQPDGTRGARATTTRGKTGAKGTTARTKRSSNVVKIRGANSSRSQRRKAS